jgi:hypothetical protein
MALPLFLYLISHHTDEYFLLFLDSSLKMGHFKQILNLGLKTEAIPKGNFPLDYLRS